MATEFNPDTLQTYTVEVLKKLCTKRHIAVYGKRKEELIAALNEMPTREFGAEQKVDELPTGLRVNMPHGATSNSEGQADFLQTDPQQLRDWQQTDSTLQRIWELAASVASQSPPTNQNFFYKEGLIYWKWRS